ncbi:2,3-dihydro-2,3-dihydroxybenzoate dehydrogenase [Thermomonospora umbrina]|uniref:2,3-dihydro-2,3-dihydroxybenzoate dehydrogenase n=1 Tax=Thermomonospora umbrina TaxID=111806 RepID=A0A3D9SX12_9ACTN|nr:2,3-dihydro-2,3-dihydroxybenzoate dehydrogenase [Thermomonospora umbrina]REE99050.1 2,3-dihydro-2,3-dihydroxybenzoate dehydrogenase [Thermomonospora umbrina]
MNLHEHDGDERKVALVTGAAGGIGGAIARVLAEHGTAVAAVDRDASRLETTVEKLRGEGLTVTGHPTDVTSAAEVTATVDRVEREIGPIDHLVNAAGVLRAGEALALSLDDWSEMFAVNATGVFLVSRAVVERMVTRRRGAVVTVASNAVAGARHGMSAYAASKAAATLFTKCLALETARHGIRCNLVAPGSTDTPMLRALWKGDDAVRAALDGRPEQFRVGIPLGRLADPADVADAVHFLLSDRAAHITMHDLTVDGGAALGA